MNPFGAGVPHGRPARTPSIVKKKVGSEGMKGLAVHGESKAKSHSGCHAPVHRGSEAAEVAVFLLFNSLESHRHEGSRDVLYSARDYINPRK
jgi:hypothetical protein